MRRTVVSALCLAVTLVSASCVNTDPDTGKTIPRGSQRFEFDVVKRRSERLKEGMQKVDVLLLLGSPAEKSSDGDVWVYLPERPAVLIPGRALQLVFEGGLLAKHGYRPIILGAGL